MSFLYFIVKSSRPFDLPPSLGTGMWHLEEGQTVDSNGSDCFPDRWWRQTDSVLFGVVGTDMPCTFTKKHGREQN